MMDEGSLSYESWVEEALRDVIKRALRQTADNGLPGEHHFFITFLTDRDDVDIPDPLRAEHPAEMTIVLQHQFHDLDVTDIGFSVTLSFNGRPCNLVVPYAAISGFTDPAVNFSLQLKTSVPNEALAVFEDAATEPEPVDDETRPDPHQDDEKMGEVIALDTFRKK